MPKHLTGIPFVTSLPDITQEGTPVVHEGKLKVYDSDNWSSVSGERYSQIITIDTPSTQTVDSTWENALVIATDINITINVPTDASDDLPVGFTFEVLYVLSTGGSEKLTIDRSTPTLIHQSTSGWESLFFRISSGSRAVVTKAGPDKWVVSNAL